MNCLVCNNDKWAVKFTYNRPDKYEAWQGIKKVHRSWIQCLHCGFYTQVRNYPLSKLEGIYKSGYRDPKFRGETIKEAFNRVNSYEYDESENTSRCVWFGQNARFNNLLDIGSGLGVFPNFLKRWDVDVTCVEENKISVKFIFNHLGIKCYPDINRIKKKFDAVSLIHVLEHIENPVEYLASLKSKLSDNGRLLIEVPDNSEFNSLDMSHDEFNSCHVNFYDMPSLCKTIERSGYITTDMHRQYYPQRNLTRIMAIAKLK